MKLNASRRIRQAGTVSATPDVCVCFYVFVCGRGPVCLLCYVCLLLGGINEA